MPNDTAPSDTPLYLTTKEVADLLRVRERKVYDLAGADEIPHRRITGKLLFPRDEIMAWIDGSGEAAPAQVPDVLTGSHDPLLAWAVGESDGGLAVLQNGSADGLACFAQGKAALAGLHIPEGDGRWNRNTVASHGLRDCVLIRWALRERGLILAPGIADRVKNLNDLAGLRMVRRQSGAGAAALLDQLLAGVGLSAEALAPAEGVARTETDAALAVASGAADAALGIAAMARQFKLGFLPILMEPFDLLIDRRAYFTPPVQSLLQVARTPEITQKAASLGGYDIASMGEVLWNAA
ncbi:substrate-binding domain-containing protein [Dinoroseobacter sp. S375]|uniref:substrate-binding domain-containing protein n=1 Tax=Dinoroseobacter sp. S375 TaxID=3415136 RepID=UPI003C7D796F